jgi:hypothetical protein
MAKKKPEHNRTSLQGRIDPAQAPNDPLLNEAPAMVRDDEEEVYDLGFIVDDHDDRRNDLLEPWQRLDTLDTDEALETDPDAPLPPEAAAMRREAVPNDWLPIDFHESNDAAESDEEEFATANQLLPDPYEAGLTTVLGDENDVANDLDRDAEPDVVNILGHAPGIAAGFGSTVSQDIGPDGFQIRDNRLMAPAAEMEYPISTEPLSDEARGLRDVDEMGSDAELDRLADQAARVEENTTVPPKKRKGSKR